MYWNGKLIQVFSFKASLHFRIAPTHWLQMPERICRPEPFPRLYSHTSKLKICILISVLQDFVRPLSTNFHVGGSNVFSWNILCMWSMSVVVSALEVSQLFYYSLLTGKFANFFHHTTRNLSFLPLQHCFCFVTYFLPNALHMLCTLFTVFIDYYYRASPLFTIFLHQS